MKTILCYGDSNTYGYVPFVGTRYQKIERWPCLLSNMLGEEYYVVEEGCSGRTTVHNPPGEPWKNGLAYLKPCLHTHKPLDIVIIMLGSNDLKTCFHVSPSEIAEGVGTLIVITQRFLLEKQGRAPHIILVSPPTLGENIQTSPFFGGENGFDEESLAKSKELSKYYKRISDKYGCTFLNASQYVCVSPEDQIHLSKEGHAALAEALYETVLNLKMPDIDAETIMNSWKINQNRSNKQ